MPSGGDWFRTLPITPWINLLRGVGSFIVFVVVFAFSIVFNGEDGDLGLFVLILIGGLVLGVVLVISAFVQWRRDYYKIDSEGVHHEHGVLFHSSGFMRADRIQTVDINRPLLGRIFGLSQLVIKSADAGDGSFTLSYLKEDHAQALRGEILYWASGRDELEDDPQQNLPPNQAQFRGQNQFQNQPPHATAPQQGTPAPQRPRDFTSWESPERKILTISNGRLLGAQLFNTVGALLGIGILVTIGAIVLLILDEFSWALLITGYGFAIPLAFISTIGGGLSSVSKFYKFSVSDTDSGVKLRYGLTKNVSQTIPPGRVQATMIEQPFFWRMVGWYRVRVAVAGYLDISSDSSDSGDNTWVLPVGTFDDVLRVLSVIAPDPGMNDATAVLKTGVKGKDQHAGFTVSPRRVFWLDALSYRRNGFRATSTMLLLRGGRLRRRLTLLPHERIQETQMGQGPLQRALNVCTMKFNIPSSTVRTSVGHQDFNVAVQLFEHETEIASHARRLSDRDKWMSATELRQFDRDAREAQETLAKIPGESTPASVGQVQNPTPQNPAPQYSAPQQRPQNPPQNPPQANPYSAPPPNNSQPVQKSHQSGGYTGPDSEKYGGVRFPRRNQNPPQNSQQNPPGNPPQGPQQ